MVSSKANEVEKWVLTDEGREIATNGSHEKRVFDSVPALPLRILIKDLEVLLFNGKWILISQTVLPSDVVKIGQGKAFKNKWIVKEGDYLKRAVASVEDTTQILLQKLLPIYQIFFA